jgi:hypothetical protein
VSVRTPMLPVLGPRPWHGTTRVRTLVLLLSVVAALAAATAGTPVGSLSLGSGTEARVQDAAPLVDPCGSWRLGGPVSGVRVVDVLAAEVACGHAALAAHARALEFDPVR